MKIQLKGWVLVICIGIVVALSITLLLQKKHLGKQGYCAEFGKDWLPFSEPESGLSFCHKKDWTFDIENRNDNGLAGTLKYISFAKDGAWQGIFMSIESTDFKRKSIEGTDVDAFDWSAVNPSLTVEQIKSRSEVKRLLSSGKVTVEKIPVDDATAVLVSFRNNADSAGFYANGDRWYLSGVLKDSAYNLSIVINPNIVSQKDAEVLLQSIHL